MPQYCLSTPTDWDSECDLLIDYIKYSVNVNCQNIKAYPTALQRTLDFKNYGIRYHFENSIFIDLLSFQEWKVAGITSRMNF